jgi:thiol:disulfide interchange protein DsbD
MSVILRRLLFVLLAGGALWLAPAVRSASPVKEGPKAPLTFTWSLSAEDPFSKANAARTTPTEFKRGESFFVTITGTLAPGFHTYPVTMHTSAQNETGLTKITYPDKAVFAPLWPVKESKPDFYYTAERKVYLEFEGQVTWTQEFFVRPTAQPGKQTLHLLIQGEACDENRCTPVDQTLEIPITVSGNTAPPLTPEMEKRLKESPPSPELVDDDPFNPQAKENTPAPKQPVPPTTVDNKAPAPEEKDEEDDDQKTERDEFRQKSFARFVLEGVGWGLLSLFTPCVFPMIPITVSFFLKKAEQKHASPLTHAAVYSGTIVVILLVGGLTIVSILQPVSQHYATNLFLGLLFLFFALSLFGMYEIVLPSGMSNFTASRQDRGGVAGTFFMSLTFTIISFACVAPFYGSFLIFSAASASWADYAKLFCGALAYSVTFAAPFFVLALFPTLLKALPKAGSGMNTMKVVMGFIEVAAALKFLRGAELAYFHNTSLLTFDLVLGMYVALSLLCGLYLLGVFRLPHDYEAQQTLGVPRLLVSLAFISLGLYLMPGLFKQGDGDRQRPRGEVYGWVESFLLPDPSTASPTKPQPGRTTTAQAPTELHWGAQLQVALQEAQDQRKYIFIDFTGHN